jgi:hypothetical protein
VQGIKQRAGDKIGRPDHRGRLDKEATSNAADGKPDELGGHDEHPLIAEVILLVIESALDGNNVCLRIAGQLSF